MYDCMEVRDLFSGVRFCANVPLCRKYGVLILVLLVRMCIGWVGDTPKIHCVSP
jgi:hypothetical protein